MKKKEANREFKIINALNDALKFLLENWIALTGFLYIYLSYLNLLHMDALYSKFNINIVDYINLGDVFVGIVSHINSLWVQLFLILSCVLYVVSQYLYMPKSRWKYSIIFVVGLVVFTNAHSMKVDGEEKSFNVIFGDPPKYTIELVSKDEKKLNDVVLIGSINRFAFYYSQHLQKVFEVPHSQIKMVIHQEKLKVFKKDWILDPEKKIRLRGLNVRHSVKIE